MDTSKISKSISSDTGKKSFYPIAFSLVGILFLLIGIALPIAYYELANGTISIASYISKANDGFMIPVYFLTIFYPYLFILFLFTYLILQKRLIKSFLKLFSAVFYFFSFYSLIWLWFVLSYLLFQEVGLHFKAVLGILLISLSILFYHYFSKKRRQDREIKNRIKYSTFLTSIFIAASLIFGIVALTHYESYTQFVQGRLDSYIADATQVIISDEWIDSLDPRYMEIKFGTYVLLLGGIFLAIGTTLSILPMNKENK